MAEIVLFHHVAGLTPGCRELADRLASGDHVVHTPDLFEGRTFATIDHGVTYLEGVGFDTLQARADKAVAGLSEHLVYIGVSLGVLAAQRMAQTRPGAVAAILLEACVPVTEFAEGWPQGVPVQVHGMDGDPFFAGEGDIDAARELVAVAAGTGQAELFVYEGGVHLFTDSSLPSYDADATAQVIERVRVLLESL
jgi:dienelactone hydrolase